MLRWGFMSLIIQFHSMSERRRIEAILRSKSVTYLKGLLKDYEASEPISDLIPLLETILNDKGA